VVNKKTLSYISPVTTAVVLGGPHTMNEQI